VLSLEPNFACYLCTLFSSRWKVLSPKCLLCIIWEGNKGKSFLAKFVGEFVGILEELGGISEVN